MAEQVARFATHVRGQMSRVIVGQEEALNQMLLVLLCGGHGLIEGVPGLAKTLAVKALARVGRLEFRRVQCTPDLMPADVLGTSVFNLQAGSFSLHRGPIFTDLLLVDEINRTPPRTQSALLEAMGEGSVTAGNVTYRLQKPFMVIATQNPIEQEGTFFLPEAQKDRFLMRVSLGYPQIADERQMMERFQLQHPIETLQPVTTPDGITKCQQAVREIKVPPELFDAILNIVRGTREHPALLLGASPRGSLGLFRAAQAMAAIQGNDSVSAGQIKTLAQKVLAHRLIVRREDKFHEVNTAGVVSEVLTQALPNVI